MITMVLNGDKKINVWFWLIMSNIWHPFWLLVTCFDLGISKFAFCTSWNGSKFRPSQYPSFVKSWTKATLPPIPSLTLNSYSSTNVYGLLSSWSPWHSTSAMLLTSLNAISGVSMHFANFVFVHSVAFEIVLILVTCVGINVKHWILWRHFFSYHVVGVAPSPSLKSLHLVYIYTNCCFVKCQAISHFVTCINKYDF